MRCLLAVSLAVLFVSCSLVSYLNLVPANVAVVCLADGEDTAAPVVSSDSGLPGDTYFGSQWAIDRLNLPQAWQITYGDSAVMVAILDTGIDRQHEDIYGRVVDEANFSVSPASDDYYGHGTHIAGIIAAGLNNGVGIVGIAPSCRLMNIKVADDRGRCDAISLADGIVWAVDQGARVLNISLCLEQPSAELEYAIDYAWEHGVVVVVAAGNGGGSAPQYPAYYDSCIAVTATREDGSRAPLASYGGWVDVAAPGYLIYSTLPGDQYGYKTGTSQAAAHVSGVAALLCSIAVDLNGDGHTNDEVRAAIEGNCQPLNGVGMGHGFVDAAAALEWLKSQ